MICCYSFHKRNDGTYSQTSKDLISEADVLALDQSLPIFDLGHGLRGDNLLDTFLEILRHETVSSIKNQNLYI